MENVMTINAETRDKVGKKIAKSLRLEGKIPSIIYGGDKESIPISLFLEDIKHVLKSEKGENAILRIRRDDINVVAMLHDIQYDYLSENVIHVDLIRVDLEKPVIVNVPIKTNGLPIGVKVEDGTFDFINREIKIKCLVTQIPNDFMIDVSDLHIGQSKKAENLEIPEGIRLISDPNTVICAVSSKTKAEVMEEVVEEEVAEVETEEKEADKDGKEKEQ